MPFLFKKSFYFDMIIDPKEVAKIGQKGPMYLLPISPNGCFSRNYSAIISKPGTRHWYDDIGVYVILSQG